MNTKRFSQTAVLNTPRMLACSLGFATLLLVLVLTAPPAQAQVCTGDVTLASQADIDAFACSEVTGRLNVSGSDIIDLSPLSELTSIGISLYIENNTALASLAGLEGLISGAPPMFTGVGNVSISGNDPGGACTSPAVVLAHSLPVLTLLGDNPLTLEAGLEPYTEPGATAASCDGDRDSHDRGAGNPGRSNLRGTAGGGRADELRAGGGLSEPVQSADDDSVCAGGGCGRAPGRLRPARAPGGRARGGVAGGGPARGAVRGKPAAERPLPGTDGGGRAGLHAAPDAAQMRQAVPPPRHNPGGQAPAQAKHAPLLPAPE